MKFKFPKPTIVYLKNLDEDKMTGSISAGLRCQPTMGFHPDNAKSGVIKKVTPIFK